MVGEIFFFGALVRELALEPLEGIHVWILVLVGVVMMSHAVDKRAGVWLAVCGCAGGVV